MANQIPDGPVSDVAAVALSYGRGVRLTATGFNVPAAAGASIFGVTLGKQATVGKAIKVEARRGIRVIVEGGGVFAKGDKLKVDADGKFVAAAGADLTDGSVVAIACEACAGDGKRSSAILYHQIK